MTNSDWEAAKMAGVGTAVIVAVLSFLLILNFILAPILGLVIGGLNVLLVYAETQLGRYIWKTMPKVAVSSSDWDISRMAGLGSAVFLAVLVFLEQGVMVGSGAVPNPGGPIAWIFGAILAGAILGGVTIPLIYAEIRLGRVVWRKIRPGNKS